MAFLIALNTVDGNAQSQLSVIHDIGKVVPWEGREVEVEFVGKYFSLVVVPWRSEFTAYSTIKVIFHKIFITYNWSRWSWQKFGKHKNRQTRLRETSPDTYSTSRLFLIASAKLASIPRTDSEKNFLATRDLWENQIKNYLMDQIFYFITPSAEMMNVF